jgi:alkanesulfonate monooxygenase SsuD/methylene tetrahydromethanopterin reductase-like flavin-dependent oxidoreductase (luciferase family)
MKYGLSLPNFSILGDVALLADLAAQAEAAGWHGVFVWDHIARKPEFDPVIDPWIAVTAMAMRTTSIRIGALITPMARRRPWKVARETASLDQLSNGRLIFGAGLGSDSSGEFASFGEEMDLKTRSVMLDEALDVLTGLWRGEPFSYEGAHYQIRDAQFLPTPVQQPRIPIWIGGFWPNKPPFRRAARWDGVVPLLTGEHIDEQLKDLLSFIHEYRDASQPFDIVGMGQKQSDDETRDAYHANGGTWWIEELNPIYFSDDWRASWTLEAIREVIEQGPARG